MRDRLQLADILEWDDRTAGLLDDLDARRLGFISHGLARALPDVIAGAVPPGRLQLLPGLSLAATERLLRSPYVCQALRTGKPHQMSAALEAEIVLDQFSDETIDSWSALGDVWLGAAPPAAAAFSLSRDPAGRLRGPSIRGGIPVDLSLDLIPSFPAASLHRSEDVDAGLTPDALDKLDEAMVLLQGASPAACSAVIQMTSNIVLRSARHSPQKIRSATSAAALGRTVLVNVGQPSVGVADVAEGILHEAIHTLISCAELEEPLIGDTAKPAGSLRSPWTGAELHPHAFLHACLVWFGLLKFWILAERQGAARDHAARRIREIAAGFIKLDLFGRDALTEVQTPLATLALLGELQERARQCV